MAAALVAAGKEEIARQEFEALLSFAPRERGEDEWRRTSGIHRIRKPRALAIVRALWQARDDIARTRDIAVGRTPARCVDRGRGNHAARQRGRARRHEGVQRARRAPLPEPLVGGDRRGPGPAGLGPARLVAAAVRAAAAAGVGRSRSRGLRAAQRRPHGAGEARPSRSRMPVENLLSPDTVRRLCWSPPERADEETVAAVLRDCGARAWQVDRCLPAAVRGPRGRPGPAGGWGYWRVASRVTRR